MCRDAIILDKFALDFTVNRPLAGLVCPQIAENELCALLRVELTVILGNHTGAMRGFVVRVILIGRVNHTHIKSHLAGIVRGDEHFSLSLLIRQRAAPQQSGVAGLGKLHQLLNEHLLLWRWRYIVEYLPFFRTVNTHILRRAVVRDLIVKRRQFRHLDKVPESVLCHNIIGNIELKIGGFLRKDCRPSVETADILPFKFFRTQVLEQQIQLCQRVADCGAAEESGSQIPAVALLNGAYGEKEV